MSDFIATEIIPHVLQDKINGYTAMTSEYRWQQPVTQAQVTNDDSRYFTATLRKDQMVHFDEIQNYAPYVACFTQPAVFLVWGTF